MVLASNVNSSLTALELEALTSLKTKDDMNTSSEFSWIGSAPPFLLKSLFSLV